MRSNVRLRRPSRSSFRAWRVVAALLFLALSLGATTARAEDPDSGVSASASDGGSNAASDPKPITARSRLDAAFDEDKGGHPVAALHAALDALELSWTERDTTTETAARAAIALFRTHCARVWFVVPKDTSDLELTFDARPVIDAKAGKSYYVDPGEHLVAARAMVRGEPHAYEEKLAVRAGENKLIEVVLSKAELVCPICESSPCMDHAKTESDVERCLKARRGCGGCGATGPGSPRLDFVIVLLVALAVAVRATRRARTTT